MPPRPASKRKSRTATSIDAVCPFCALLCDDLKLRDAADRSFEVTRNGCARARADFGRAPVTGGPLVRGRVATLEEAVAVAARILKKSDQPLIAGLATDVEGTRAAINLAERCGAILDHLHGDVMNAMTAVLQSRGWYATTLSELRNRADFVLLAGVDLNDRYENLLRRCLRPAAGLDRETVRNRRVIYLGRARSAPPDESIETVSCLNESLAAILQALLAALRGSSLKSRSIGAVSRKTLEALAATLRAARSSVIVFSPAALGVHRESAVAAVCDIVDELNRNARAAILSLGGDDGGQTAMSTCAWMTGYPLRVSFGRTVRYDPVGYSTAKLTGSGAVDSLLWIDAFGRNSTPPACAATIVLGSVKPHKASQLSVYIPVGTPGVDHAAGLIRTDAVVSLPLAGLRDTGLPAVSAVLSAIADRM